MTSHYVGFVLYSACYTHSCRNNWLFSLLEYLWSHTTYLHTYDVRSHGIHFILCIVIDLKHPVRWHAHDVTSLEDDALCMLAFDTNLLNLVFGLLTDVSSMYSTIHWPLWIYSVSWKSQLSFTVGGANVLCLTNAICMFIRLLNCECILHL